MIHKLIMLEKSEIQKRNVGSLEAMTPPKSSHIESWWTWRCLKENQPTPSLAIWLKELDIAITTDNIIDETSNAISHLVMPLPKSSHIKSWRKWRGVKENQLTPSLAIWLKTIRHNRVVYETSRCLTIILDHICRSWNFQSAISNNKNKTRGIVKVENNLVVWLWQY